MDHEDVQEQIIMALLPHVLSTCRRITHNGRNFFIKRYLSYATFAAWSTSQRLALAADLWAQLKMVVSR